MKKNIFICLLFAIFFVGCKCTNPEYEQKKQEQPKHEQIWKGYSVIVIDDCEYLKKDTIKYNGSKKSYAYAELAHKGNCKFCEERRKNEKKDTIFIIKHDTVYVKNI